MAALLWCAMISAAIGSAGPVGREVDRTRLWHRSGRDLLSGFCNMYNFHVLREPRGAFPYRARFFGWAAADGNPGYPGCDAIFAARSRHLLRGWQVYAGERGWVSGEPAAWVPVLTARDLYFDQWHNGDPGGYGSHPWRSRKIVEAVSADGINWLVLGYVNADPDVAATHVPEAFVRRLDQGRWRIYVFYACQVGGEPYNYRYGRLRCMWRDVTAEELAALGRLCRRRAHAEPCKGVRAPALLALGSLLVRGRMVERREAGTGSLPQDFRRRSR